ncbi:serine threonine kinase ark1 [Trichoderma cornu-damae]|uniref:non-specific serine/threonine protein kinase n=1 Tax=Trichoderma cornu-damae TaxID=654480 RepID=A0A9P8TTC9_9HYPO|nr:serine threonine kinase ark1 [Trichoderma cornu-damae]
MASHGHRMAPQAHHPHAGYPASGAPPAVVPPAGTFAPGTKIQVGNHRVQIQKYLSEGGFAHVYLVKLPKAVDGTDLAVLKRVAVPDKEALRGMRTEVETMKRLKGHRAIVTYIDSHASELKGGGYEVFLLMEFCDGGGLIDFMNTRLQHRLTEPEILTIFADIAEGVACMHYLKPPLLHRDLKVENVLIANGAAGKRFKLCDFGSAAAPRSAPTTVVDCRLMDEDVQKHTTLQYRSPEMVDVYRKQPINEKSDIWALGVLLYKLCYYTTPFEDQGQLAILNASYRYPSYPVFSDRLKKLIAMTLQENMQSRPNIYQVLKEACAMQGREMPIHDIYSGRASADPGADQHASAMDPKPHQTPVVGAVFSSAPAQEQQVLPEITPMRRGRPTPSPSRTPVPGKVADGDPFAALDSKATALRRADPDELSSRFPRLEEFSLLHEQKTFNFDSTPASSRPQKDLNTKVAERLADEAFASSRSPAPSTTPVPRPHSVAPISSRPPPPDVSPPGMETKALPKLAALTASQSGVSRAQSIITSNPELKAIASKTANSSYVSTGTMTEKSPDRERHVDAEGARRSVDVETPRAPRAAALTGQNTAKRHSGGNWASANTRSSSVQPRLSQSTVASSRTSLDILSSQEDLIDMRPSTNDAASKQRPVSSTFEPSTLEYLRERENASKPSSRQSSATRHSSWHLPLSSSNTGRNNNDGGASLKEQAPRSSRSSEVKDHDLDRPGQRSDATPSTSKNLLSSKFGGAFKRFENNAPSSDNESDVRSSSPGKEPGRRALTPIQGSEAADDRSDSDGEGHRHMTAEMRREMERRQLEEEEARVGAAQAEYRRRVAEGGSPSKARPGTAPKPMGAARAASIQNRVQSLLSEEQKPSGVPRTAHGYGKYTDSEPAEPALPGETERPRPEVKRKPAVAAKPTAMDPRRSDGSLVDAKQAAGSASAPVAKSQAKPAAPKKPVHLNNVPTGGRQASSPTKERDEAVFERLIAIDLPGQPMLEMTSRQRDDYIGDFTKRFPSLSTIELGREGGREREGPQR